MDNALESMSAPQIVRLFVAAWDRDHPQTSKEKRKTVKSRKRKLRRIDPHDWIRTLKKPKAKS